MKKQYWTIKVLSTHIHSSNVDDAVGTYLPVERWTDPYPFSGSLLDARAKAFMELGITVNGAWNEGHQLISAWVELTGQFENGEYKTEMLQFHSTPKK